MDERSNRNACPRWKLVTETCAMVMPGRTLLVLLLVTNWLVPDQIRAVLCSSSADEPRLTGNLRVRENESMPVLLYFVFSWTGRGREMYLILSRGTLFFLVIPLSKRISSGDRIKIIEDRSGCIQVKTEVTSKYNKKRTNNQWTE